MTWDVIVIGTGMGGASTGYELARLGYRVLFLEKGKSFIGRTKQSGYAETHWVRNSGSNSINERKDLFRALGRETRVLQDINQKGKETAFVPFAGSGTGGSTLIYGNVLNRFYPEDFKNWGIDYDTLRPYYKTMESLFGAKGALDPFRSSSLDPIATRPPINPRSFAFELSQHFKKQGLNPFQPPLAISVDTPCKGCQGQLCPKGCRKDALNVFIEPAVSSFGATLLDECEVLELKTDSSHERINEVIAKRYSQQLLTLQAKIIVLAAGALESPGILLRSKSTHHPHGLANSSGKVGRGLLRNLYDLYLMFPKNKIELEYGVKEIYLNDFYQPEKGQLGIIQSFGTMPAPEVFWDGLLQLIPRFRFFLRPLRPLFLAFLANVFRRAYVLVTTTEDTACDDNRIETGEGNTVRLTYGVSPNDALRVNQLRQIMKNILKPYFFIRSEMSEDNQTFISIAAGTCRMGRDPKTSVVGPNNRAHDVENLYVVDASFYPTNPAQNKSLTLGANGLRVGNIIHQCLAGLMNANNQNTKVI